jgi:hypothetical protein
MRAATSTGICTSGTPRWCAPTSTPPVHAGAGAIGGGEATVKGVDEALGRSQGGFSTKLHLRAEGSGRPITTALAAGERHE